MNTSGESFRNVYKDVFCLLDMVEKRITMKRILVVALVGLFLLSLSASFVSAESLFEKFFGENAETIYSDWLGGGDFNTNLAKVLLTVLITLIVYSISSKIPGLKNLFEGSKWFLGVIFSVIIGFLAMAYITPDEVYVIVMSYSALGFALGAGIPFIVLLFFTITLATEHEGGAKGVFLRKILAYALWVGFAGFMIYRIFFVDAGDTTSAIYSTLNWIILIVTIGVVIFLGAIFAKLMKADRDARIKEAEDKTKKATAKTEMDSQAIDELSEEKKPE